ncbi:MAG: glycosyltransferase [Granulosicoccus sp.]
MIVQIAPTPFFSDRGCHIRIEGITRCIQTLGYETVVCTYHHGNEVPGVTTQRISTIKNYTNVNAGPDKYKILADWKLLLLCIKQFRLHQPSALHCHLHEGVLIGLTIKALFFWKKVKIVGDIQGSLEGELEEYGFFKKYRLLRRPVRFAESLLFRLATRLNCSSQLSYDFILKTHPRLEGKLNLVRDGADRPGELTLNQSVLTRDSLGIPANAFTIVYSGSLLESKGITELKELIRHCKTDDKQVHFLVIGYPVEEFEEYLQVNALESLCTLTGRINFSDLPSYLKLANLAIDPKNSKSGEGSGKIMNYIANDLPVLAFDTGSNRQYFADRRQLMNSVDEFRSMIIDLRNNSSLLAEFAVSNSNHFENHFSWSMAARQLENVYPQIRAADQNSA